MQDYNYIWGQCFEITLELSCCKYPPANQLEKFWRDNKAALIEYIKQVHLGGYAMGKGAKAEAKPVGKVGALQQPRSVSELTGEELWPEPASYHFGLASATRPGMGKGELARVRCGAMGATTAMQGA